MLVAALLDWGSRPLHAMASTVDSFALAQIGGEMLHAFAVDFILPYSAANSVLLSYVLKSEKLPKWFALVLATNGAHCRIS